MFNVAVAAAAAAAGRWRCHWACTAAECYSPPRLYRGGRRWCCEVCWMNRTRTESILWVRQSSSPPPSYQLAAVGRVTASGGRMRTVGWSSANGCRSVVSRLIIFLHCVTGKTRSLIITADFFEFPSVINTTGHQWRNIGVGRVGKVQGAPECKGPPSAKQKK